MTVAFRRGSLHVWNGRAFLFFRALGFIGWRMRQSDTQFGGNQAEMIAAERGAVISVEAPGHTKPPYCHHEVVQKAFCVLGQVKGGCHYIAGGVIYDGVKIGFPLIEAFFDSRSMEKVGTPEIAEVGVFKGFDTGGCFRNVTIETLCGSKAIDGRATGPAAVPYPFSEQFIKQALDREKRMVLSLQGQCNAQRFRNLCSAAVFPLFVAQSGQAEVLVTPEPQAQGVGREYFLLPVRCVEYAFRQSAQFPV